MASVTVRNIPDETKKKLKARAMRHGRSLEEELRVILNSTVDTKPQQKDLGTTINEMFKKLGGTDDLPVYPRDRLGPPPDFSEW